MRHGGQGGEVEDPLRRVARHQLAHRLGVEQVQLLVGEGRAREWAAADAQHLRSLLGALLGQVLPHEAADAGDQDPHQEADTSSSAYANTWA